MTVCLQADISSSDLQHCKQQCCPQHSNASDPVSLALHIFKCERRKDYF